MSELCIIVLNHSKLVRFYQICIDFFVLSLTKQLQLFLILIDFPKIYEKSLFHFGNFSIAIKIFIKFVILLKIEIFSGVAPKPQYSSSIYKFISPTLQQTKMKFSRKIGIFLIFLIIFLPIFQKSHISWLCQLKNLVSNPKLIPYFKCPRKNRGYAPLVNFFEELLLVLNNLRPPRSYEKSASRLQF